MTPRALNWGIGLLAGAIALFSQAFPGSEGMATGPRIGMGAFLMMLSLIILGVPTGTWFIRTFTRPADYQGTCPVGEPCTGCGAFNMKPRQDCRSCGGPVNRADGQPGVS